MKLDGRYDAMLTIESLPVRERGLKFCTGYTRSRYLRVAPRAGAWIEIEPNTGASRVYVVAPRAGAWIEIWRPGKQPHASHVAPRAGAWIEIISKAGGSGLLLVAPRAGAWIEILLAPLAPIVTVSLPVRERGLKFLRPDHPGQ